jgi:hypothetical protein
MLGITTGFTDVLQTVLNATGYLTSAVLVSRFSAAPATAPEPAPGHSTAAGAAPPAAGQSRLPT